MEIHNDSKSQSISKGGNRYAPAKKMKYNSTEVQIATRFDKGHAL